MKWDISSGEDEIKSTSSKNKRQMHLVLIANIGTSSTSKDSDSKDEV